MPIDFAIVLNLLSRAGDRSETETEDARRAISELLIKDSPSFKEKSLETISFLQKLELEEDFSGLDRILRSLVENGALLEEIEQYLVRLANSEELTLRSIARRVSWQLKKLTHRMEREEAEEPQEPLDAISPSPEEIRVIKALCAFSLGKSGSNNFKFFRYQPQVHLKNATANLVVISKDDCHSTVEKTLDELAFLKCYSYKAALAQLESNNEYNFVLLDLSLPRGEHISMEEYEIRDLTIDKLLNTNYAAEYYDISHQKTTDFEEVEHEGRIYYYKRIQINKNEYVASQLKAAFFKPAFEDINLDERDRVLISRLIPANIKAIRYERIKSGFSGSRNYLVDPLDENGKPQKKSVIKIGEKAKLRQEYECYHAIIEPKIQHPLRVSQIFFEDESLAALRYEFASGIVGRGSRTFKRVYEMSETEYDKHFPDYHRTKMEFLKWKVGLLFHEMLAGFNHISGPSTQKLGKEFADYVKDDQISKNFQAIMPQRLDDEAITLYGSNFANPRSFWIHKFKDCFQNCFLKPVHGDLHSENVMIDDDGLIFLIDYGKTRNDGNLFTDYAMFEVSIKLDLISRNTPYPIILEFERSLYAIPDLGADLKYSGEYSSLRDACELISEVRKQAHKLTKDLKLPSTMANPFYQYLFALFPLTYAQLAFPDMNQQYALLSSGLIAGILKEQLPP